MFEVTRYEQRDLFCLEHHYAIAHCVVENLNMSVGIATIFKKKFRGLEVLPRQQPKIGRFCGWKERAI